MTSGSNWLSTMLLPRHYVTSIVRQQLGVSPHLTDRSFHHETNPSLPKDTLHFYIKIQGWVSEYLAIILRRVCACYFPLDDCDLRQKPIAGKW